MKRLHLAALGTLVLFAAGAGAAVAQEPLVEKMRVGREKFEQVCSRCHALDLPLGKKADRSQWETLIGEMKSRGAKLEPGEGEAIANYLSAMLLFGEKCTVCHAKEKVLDRERTLAQWSTMVKDMSGKNPELLSADEATAISAYLSVILGH